LWFFNGFLNRDLDISLNSLETFLSCGNESILIHLLDFQKDGLKEIENMQAELTEAGYKRSVNNLFAVYMKVQPILNHEFLT